MPNEPGVPGEAVPTASSRRSFLSTAVMGNLLDTFNLAPNAAYIPRLPRVAVTEPLTDARKAHMVRTVQR